jgi:excisionase family DNA binding protein
MNAAVNALYAEYLEHTGGDKAAAASLALAAVLRDCQPAAGLTKPTPADAEPASALTVAQAAKRLGVVPKTIYEMCQSRRLRSFRPGAGRVLRIPVEDVDRLENESGARDPAPRFPEVFKRHF